MKHFIAVTWMLILWISSNAQDYPFQNPELDDKARLDNLILLMNIEEKINCLSPWLSVPRLGITGTRIWDTERKAFILEKGTVNFFIGASSVDSRLTGIIDIN
jgi:hypothetical protein